MLRSDLMHDGVVGLIPFTTRPNIEPADLPPLPEIRADALRQQVFTHRSYFARPTHVFEDTPDDPSPDNEWWVSLSSVSLSAALLINDAHVGWSISAIPY